MGLAGRFLPGIVGSAPAPEGGWSMPTAYTYDPAGPATRRARGQHAGAGPRDPRIGVDDVHVRRSALDRARADGRLGSDHPPADHRPLRSVGEAPDVARAAARVERARWGSALPGQRAGAINGLSTLLLLATSLRGFKLPLPLTRRDAR